MSLDFSSKHEIIERVGNPDSWQNVFDDAFFDDKRRKWSSASHGDITVTFDKDFDKDRAEEIEAAEKEGREPDLSAKRTVIISYRDRKKDVSSELIIEESDIGFLITDERGVTVSSATPYSEMTQLEETAPAMEAANDAGTEFPHRALIDHLGIIVEFSNKGQKRITFENSNSYIELESSDTPVPDGLKTGRFFNVVNLDGAFLGELARSKQNPFSFIMLVMAKDLGLEPSLKSFNGFDPEAPSKVSGLLKTMGDFNQWTGSALRRLGGVGVLEKIWRDTAEFNGYKTAIPTNFSASEKEDGSIGVQTTSTGKERVLSRSHLLSKALGGEAPTHSLQGISGIFAVLADAQSVEDRGKTPWQLITIEHKGNFDGIKALIKAARKDYLLSTDEFAVINMSPDLAMMAITQEALEKCLGRKPMSDFELEKEAPPAPSNVVALRPRS